MDDQIEIRIYYGGKWHQRIFHSNQYNLLAAIDKTIKIHKLNLFDLKGIAAAAGKGRFTASRVAVTVANTLALACHARVVAVDKFDVNLAAKIRRAKLGCYISAKYSGEAKIGGQKNVK